MTIITRPLWARALAVAAIALAFLALFAIPTYREYTMRADVAGAMWAVHGQRLAIARAWQRGPAPAVLDIAAVPAPTSARGVTRLKVAGGVIQMTFGPPLDPELWGRTLAFTAAIGPGQELGWVCGSASPDAGFKPVRSDYRSLTTLPDKYLLPACRAPA